MSCVSNYTPDLGKRILALMTEGLSLAAAAAECDVYRQRVYDWEKIHPDFGELVALARGKRQLFFERRLLSATDGPVVTSTIFGLKNVSEDWREKSEVDLNHKGGINVTISSDDAAL